MFKSLGKYFELIQGAERLDEECAHNAAQVRLACAEAEQFSEVVGQHELVDKFCTIPQWKRLGRIIESLHDEEVATCVAELLYRLTPIQEVIQVRRAQANEIIEMIDLAMTQQGDLQLTYTRKRDDITGEYFVTPQEVVWLNDDDEPRRAMIAIDMDGNTKAFYIHRIRKMELA